MPISPSEIESLLREGLSTEHPGFAVLLADTPDAVVERDRDIRATLLFCVLAPDRSMRDMKSQEVCLVPGAHREDAARTAAFVRQWTRALPDVVAASPYEIDTIMPHDLLCRGALHDDSLRTDADFEAALRDRDRVRGWFLQSERDQVAEELAGWGLESSAAEFLALRRDAIWLGDSVRVDDDDEDEDERDEPTPVGSTRFGGEPDLPPEIEWPMRDGEPLTFAAQLDLEALQGFPAARELPASGLLSFFYAFDPATSFMVSRVLHIPSKEGLARRRTPAGGDRRPELTAEPVAQPDTMPSGDSPFYHAFLPVEKVAAFHRSLAEAAQGAATVLDPLPGLEQYLASWNGHDPDEQNHRVLGYAQPYQNDPYLGAERHCVRRTWDGPSPGSPEGIAESRRSRRWRLLLQVWAMIDGELLLNQDCGALYFMIPEDALAAHDWSQVWCEMQCS